MDQSTFNHGKSGDTNPKGRSRSPLLELYTRSLRNGREEKIGHGTSAACGGRLRLCYTLDEGKESERETTNCPPKRVRSSESMILEPPESVQKLQAALQAKAKEVPGYRFYLLYDKLYRKDVIACAYRCCRANAGAPGVDGQDFADIAKYREDRWLGELADTLRRKTYRAEAVRRVWIPKADGKKLRPLGIPCVADRVVM